MVKCDHYPVQHSIVTDKYFYCEECHAICSIAGHHISQEKYEAIKGQYRKRTLFCRGNGHGHDVESKDLVISKELVASCGLHPQATYRWKAKLNWVVDQK